MNLPNDLRSLQFGKSTAIIDPKAVDVIKNLQLDLTINQTEFFCTNYRDWISKTNLNVISGLDNFQYQCYSNGTTEAFDKFYFKNHNRRFRCFKGEYVYHRLAWRNSWPNWCYIEDDKLDANDAVVISLPFSDTGNEHQRNDWLLDICDSLGIPVLVDCAYFGTCRGIKFNFNHPCISDITFSLSKVFPVAGARIGIRFTKIDDDDPLFVVNKIKYTNVLGPQIGLELIKNFSADYINNKYCGKQRMFCEQYNVTESKTVLFGIGGQEWHQYNRGTKTNRLCFAPYYES